MLVKNQKEGLTWHDGRINFGDTKMKYNLGLSHGLPSIIVLLCKVLERNIEPIIVKELIQEASSWLLNKKDENGVLNLFPNFVPANPPFQHRLAWCYGDLGIALTFLQTGTCLSDEKLMQEGINIALRASKRKGKEAGSVDTGLCHGTAGVAHIFNRFYHYTQIAEFRETAIYWYKETLRFYDEYGHFNHLRLQDSNNGEKVWEESHGVLEGTAGVGLALLAAVSDIEPKWDRCLLLS